MQNSCTFWRIPTKRSSWRVFVILVQNGVQLGVRRGVQNGVLSGVESGVQRSVQNGVQSGVQSGSEEAVIEVAKYGVQSGVHKVRPAKKIPTKKRNLGHRSAGRPPWAPQPRLKWVSWRLMWGRPAPSYVGAQHVRDPRGCRSCGEIPTGPIFQTFFSTGLAARPGPFGRPQN